jgi:plastocyanin
MATTGASPDTMPTDRRRFLALGGIALGAFAGCSSQAPSNEGEDATATATPTATATATPTPTSDQPPGADVLGGPDDLRSDPTVDAATLSADRGVGQFVFTPAVVWVEPGTTVEWTISGGSHSVTAYHPNNDRSMRIPEGATPFDSGVLESGETFEQPFETPGVHNYYCTPHEGLGMVGLVVVSEARGGPGTADPSGVETSAAAQNLGRLLTLVGVEGGRGQASYGWQAATWDSYWYSLYNMSTNIAMSGNGVPFPHNEEQQRAFERRVPAMLSNADVDEPPSRTPTSTWRRSPGATHSSPSGRCSTRATAVPTPRRSCGTRRSRRRS